MKPFYCVQAEFYTNGHTKFLITERTCREKPRNQYRRIPIGNFYLDWFESRELAEKYLEERRSLGKVLPTHKTN